MSNKSATPVIVALIEAMLSASDEDPRLSYESRTRVYERLYPCLVELDWNSEEEVADMDPAFDAVVRRLGDAHMATHGLYGVEAERAAVVAYLRAAADEFSRLSLAGGEHASSVTRGLADSIARNEHRGEDY